MEQVNIESENELMKTLAVACRVLGTEGQDDLNLGHVSARSKINPDIMFMKARGLCLSEVYPEDLVALDFHYKKLDGKREPHGELPIHIEIYRKRPDVNCVVHTHPLYATAFSATDQILRPINNEGVMFAKPLPCFDQVTDLIVTPELGIALADKLGDSNAIFLKNHGIVVVGKSIEEAAVRSFLLEKTLKTLFVAKVFGEPKYTEDDEADQKAQNVFSDHKIMVMWNTLVRQLEYREAPLKILKMLEKKIGA